MRPFLIAGGGIGFDESDDIYLTRTYRFFTTTGWSLAAKYGSIIQIDGKDVDFHKLRETAAKLFAEQADAYLAKIGKPYTRKDVNARTVELLDQYLETLEKVHSSVDKTVVDSLGKDLDRFKPKKDIDGALGGRWSMKAAMKSGALKISKFRLVVWWRLER